MASAVATPLERQFTRIAAVSEMTSTSFLGSTSVALQFDLSRDINGAARDVQSAINAASGQLPSNLPSNPTYRKVNPADAPIMILALTSATATPGKLYDMASTILQQKLAQLEGVGQVFVGGSSLPAVRVELESPRARPLRHRARGRARGAGQRQRQPAQGPDPRAGAGVGDPHQRPDPLRGGVPPAAGGLAQRGRGPPGGRGRRARLGRGPALDRPRQRPARRAPHHLPPARRQHHRRGGPHPRGAARAARAPARRRRP